MGVRYLSYLDLPPARRAAAGAAVASDLQRALAMPGLAPEQRQEIRAQIERVSSWVDGTLEHSAPDVPHAEVEVPVRISEPEIEVEPEVEPEVVTPRQHVVVVSETINLDDDLA